MSNFAVVIPARYASERLPGKPLRKIAGKDLLQHVFERATESDADQVVVATDDDRIEQAARKFGADVCMTSPGHRSGTERLAEVARLRRWADDLVVVNLQGDEPMMPAALINQCASLLKPSDVVMATLASPVASLADFHDPNVVKVLVDANRDAIYFSRAAIPHPRSSSMRDIAIQTALHHHGIYAYRVATLQQIVAAAPSQLEQIEQLEQLRALELGIRIRVGRPAGRPGPGVDTEADLLRVERLILAGA
jgi:3-deoxy-manno-octulosonate cytidylyltransferase (CMP-KDO synthetase)